VNLERRPQPGHPQESFSVSPTLQRVHPLPRQRVHARPEQGLHLLGGHHVPASKPSMPAIPEPSHTPGVSPRFGVIRRQAGVALLVESIAATCRVR